MDGWMDESINLDMNANQIEEVPSFSQREKKKTFFFNCIGALKAI